MTKQRKYVLITGGVLSGLGKGVTIASIGFFFSNQYKVLPIKLDGYLNVDPGTMNPIEHGEVFVLDDGFEVDMDFGHYERFLNISSVKAQSITMGQIYDGVRIKERNGDYQGKTVQLIPHVTNFIQEKIDKVVEETDSEIVFIEIGGTIGDLENEMYIEALRQLKLKVGQENIAHIHLSYVPIPVGVNEQKTKPTQQSVSLLHSKGLWPDFIVCRCSENLNESTKRKIGLFANIPKENVFTAVDVDSIYKIPDKLNSQNIIEQICQKLELEVPNKGKLDIWNNLLNSQKQKKLIVAIAGKYTGLEDSYASVVEALKHSELHFNCKIDIMWIDTEKVDKNKLEMCDSIIVPGGFGTRGIEGKIEVIKFAREHKIPYLGICYGLQLAMIEFARNVCQIKDATSAEINPKSQNQIVTLMDEQKGVVQIGGTLRLGNYDAKLEDSQVKELYKQLNLIDENDIVKERHRHRFEVNPNYVKQIESKGLKVIGKNPQRDLVEFIELEKDQHPYFVATQAHPELKSKLEKPAPLFYGLIKTACQMKKE